MSKRHLKCRQYASFRRLLNVRRRFSAPGLGRRLNNIGIAYRNRILNPLRSRKEDRAVNLRLAELAEAVAATLEGGAFGLLPGVGRVPPVPIMGGRQEWLRGIGLDLVSLRRSSFLEESGDVERDRFRADLLELSSAILSLDTTAVRHPMWTLAATPHAPSSEGWTGQLSDALCIIAVAARTARDCWEASRGPEPRSAMQLLARDLYEAINEARGESLMLRIHDETSSYIGRPGNDDTRFLLAFVEWVHGTVPKRIQARCPSRFVSTAVFDAYKKHSEAVRRAGARPKTAAE